MPYVVLINTGTHHIKQVNIWIVMASDLHPLSVNNVLLKYADDVNLLAPENTDI